ncbi:MAG: biotin--[acetyl-CoA-carboxylase] ligase [Ruminococcaceae bacterium]|nr:biotin--[acetyl-CoA-carboxylase] ligase [Oscillospiraceae bacterium]
MTVKDNLLNILENSEGNPLSGQELADRLGVSRNAVWKAMKGLMEQGYELEVTHSRGYRLIRSGDILTEEGVRSYLPDDLKKNKIIILKTVDSTNTYGKKIAADGAENGTVIIAEQQTAGRGRRGNSFYSPDKKGIYMSVIFRRGQFKENPDLFTICAGCSVCAAIERLTDKKPLIKWVNDVYLEGKKICGILSEATLDIESGTVDSVVVGIGVNLTTDDFPEELKEKAGSIGEPVARNHIAAEIITQLYRCLDRSREENLADYKAHSLVLGKEVHYIKNNEPRSGKAIDIDDKGQLIVITENGQDVLNSGEISVKL